MTTMQDREKAFEKKFVLDQELKFKAEARRNKMLAEWAAGKLGLTGPAIDDTMYGVFFEDINYAADGGLYAELVRNRSFEFLPVDNRCYTGLTGWTPRGEGGGNGTAAAVNDGSRLNERNRTYLQLTLANTAGGTYGVSNSGWNNGVALEAGKRYDFSVWARSDTSGGTPLTVSVRDEAGATSYADPVKVQVNGDTWKKYAGTFTASSTTDSLYSVSPVYTNAPLSVSSR
jgi:hypothetical protein